MLFHSPEFFLFLLITLTGFYLIGYTRKVFYSILWLISCSLFFYGWWNPSYLLLIGSSIFGNYLFGKLIEKKRSLSITVIAVIFNLGLIGYFKYAGFFMDTAKSLAGINWGIEEIILPLAISFFTFQQIAFIVDVYRGNKAEDNIFKYCFFVVFFPQLIAGPIVHHNQTIPQLTENKVLRNYLENFSIGYTYFIFGLFKKLVIADGVAQYATPAFEAAEYGYKLSFIEAWSAAIAYTFQIYFDFSGYSDMAIGLARMFGIKLPINFNSPYKSISIIEFWRRWHMTLSAFLRNYLYVPLGGNRKGTLRKYFNILIVMFLGGLWHGAGWTYIVWGILHGFYLLLNHFYRYAKAYFQLNEKRPTLIYRIFCFFLTMLCVIIAWVIFRSETMNGAEIVLKGMAGINGIVLPYTYESYASWLNNFPIDIKFQSMNYYHGKRQVFWYLFLLCVVIWLPNTHEIMNRSKPALNPPDVKYNSMWRLFDWHPSFLYATIIGILALTSLFMIFIGRRNEFLYFQF